MSYKCLYVCLSLGCVRLFATHELELARLLCPWDSPDKNIGMGCHSLLQGIFPTQGLNSGLLHCRQIPHHLSHWRSPNVSIIHDYLTRLMGRLKLSLVWKWFQQLREWSKSQVLNKTLSGHSAGRERWKSWEVV